MNPTHCPICNQPWEDHEAAVPIPACPKVATISDLEAGEIDGRSPDPAPTAAESVESKQCFCAPNGYAPWDENCPAHPSPLDAAPQPQSETGTPRTAVEPIWDAIQTIIPKIVTEIDPYASSWVIAELRQVIRNCAELRMITADELQESRRENERRLNDLAELRTQLAKSDWPNMVIACNEAGVVNAEDLVMHCRELRTQLAQVTAERDDARDVARQESDIRHKQRDDLKARLEAANRQLSDYRLESRQANDYILKIGQLLGCSDGDDTPEIRIAELRKDSERLEDMIRTCGEFRDEVLFNRGHLEEGTLDNDQTNAVLRQYDDTIGSVISAQEQ